MCCFIVPMVEAIATTAIRKSNASKQGLFMSKLSNLEKMLWGGTIMLIVDHIINGEVTLAYPFFTALGKTGGVEVMLHEMLTVGVPMALLLTAIWAIQTLVAGAKVKKLA